MLYQNKPPVRPATREPVFDVIDGECDHIAEAMPEASITDFLSTLAHRIRKARAEHVEGEAAATVVAANNLREIAGLAVRAMETIPGGTIPREYRVPPSANIVGALNASDDHDSL